MEGVLRASVKLWPISSVLHFKHSPLKEKFLKNVLPWDLLPSLLMSLSDRSLPSSAQYSRQICDLLIILNADSPVFELVATPSCFCCRSLIWCVFSYMCWCACDDYLEWFYFKDSLGLIKQWLNIHSSLCIKCLRACPTLDYLRREWDCCIDVVNGVMAVKQWWKHLRFALNSPVGINLWIKMVSLT